LLDAAGISSGEINTVAVGKGPGSYTGVRVGMIFGAVTAWATGADFQAVPSLLALGASIMEISGAQTVVSTANAYRGEVYVRVVRRNDGEINAGRDDVVPAASFRDFVQTTAAACGGEVTVAGFGCDLLVTDVPGGVRLLREEPEAGALAVLRTTALFGAQEFAARPEALPELYLRKAAAEIQMEQKQP
ncbi:MAG TPA: tRNA (adenosine(37)-N6)-threonylcarbamoyltransferase complex dimerization subunit type 1 TsaB, partial [Planctomycetes bacterium]|nr:tRNA (adenosine(37)-N6)-threonylcarbamoyltransferase complex dimerization subunit type 1 TsaB [Planctomycetota bacterium]